MRTKALLLTAAVGAAGIASSMAQVYSVNVVGFVNVPVIAGFNLLNNPLNGTNNSVSTILQLPDDQAQATVTGWDEGIQGFGASSTYFGGGFWDSPQDIPPGKGFFFYANVSATLTFVGEVLQGNLTNTVPGNFSFKGSMVPQSGSLVGDLAFKAAAGDTITFWDPNTQGYTGSYTYFGEGVWDPAEPTVAVGQGFVLYRDPGQVAGNNWVRTFNVQ